MVLFLSSLGIYLQNHIAVVDHIAISVPRCNPKSLKLSGAVSM